MLGTYINFAFILAGSFVGLLFKSRISDRFMKAMSSALALCVLAIGITSAIKTENTLCVIICMVIGTLLGVALKIEDRLDHLGEWLKKKVMRKGDSSRFTEGFVSASLLFCIGSMAIMGSIEAGINHNYAILVSKGVIDGVTSISFAAAMGIGVAFSALPVLVYQGILTILASFVGPFLSDVVILEMSAVGGTIIMGIGFNMLFPDKHIPVGNMLPAIFLPILYLPLTTWLSSVL